jgi:hypothetical protein
VQDTRKVLTADPRNAVLALKQVSITFPAGTSAAAAEPTLQKFAAATQNIGGCGGADKVAADFKGDVVQSDGVKLRDLPAALQDMMLPMQVGQATRPFGSIDEGVRVLVICGRDEEQSASAPNPTLSSRSFRKSASTSAPDAISATSPRRRHRLSLRWQTLVRALVPSDEPAPPLLASRVGRSGRRSAPKWSPRLGQPPQPVSAAVRRGRRSAQPVGSVGRADHGCVRSRSSAGRL